MDEDLRKDLAKDLKKSGFYSELRTIQIFVARDWECHGSFTYYDKDEKTSRECDFEAVTHSLDIRRRKGVIQLSVRLVGQVKKSEKPWIVFRDRVFRPEDTYEAWENIIHVLNLPLERSQLSDALSQESLISTNGWKASGIHEAFKNPNDTSRWYGAFVSACKAAESAFDATIAASESESDLVDQIYFDIIKPIVVLDGVLVSAEVDEHGELSLQQIESAAFRFEYRSEAYQRRHYCLDLVTLDGLPAYLDLAVTRMKRISATLVAHDNLDAESNR